MNKRTLFSALSVSILVLLAGCGGFCCKNKKSCCPSESQEIVVVQEADSDVVDSVVFDDETIGSEFTLVLDDAQGLETLKKF